MDRIVVGPVGARRRRGGQGPPADAGVARRASAATAGASWRPFSDVDLLVLHGEREPDAVREGRERAVPLLALGPEARGRVRRSGTSAPASSSPREDHTARTALLDLRHLAGDRALYRELEREELHGLSQAKVDKFLADKLEEMRDRRERFGDSLYLLEPNVKESEGGLRDLQSALWLARVRFKVAGITELLSRALLPERDIREMRRARDFLWRVRNEMHYLAGRKWDQLTFDVQPQVADGSWATRDGEHGSAVEQFMRHYYLAAKTVLVACDAIVDRCLEPQNASGWRMVPPPAATIGAERPVPLLRGSRPAARTGSCRAASSRCSAAGSPSSTRTSCAARPRRSSGSSRRRTARGSTSTRTRGTSPRRRPRSSPPEAADDPGAEPGAARLLHPARHPRPLPHAHARAGRAAAGDPGVRAHHRAAADRRLPRVHRGRSHAVRGAAAPRAPLRRREGGGAHRAHAGHASGRSGSTSGRSSTTSARARARTTPPAAPRSRRRPACGWASIPPTPRTSSGSS